MRVVAYSIQEYEKELLAKANAKVHDLTLISNTLNPKTLHYSIGKEVVIISEQDFLDKNLLEELSRIGVKKIITRSSSVDNIDLKTAGLLQLHIANTPTHDITPEGIAEQTIHSLNNWEEGRCLGQACQCAFDCSNKQEKTSSYGNQ